MDVEKFSSGDSRSFENFSRHSSGIGFGRTLDDPGDHALDLNVHLIGNKAATYLMQVTCNSMADASIDDGDIVVVDRSLKPQSGKIVIAVIEGELLIRRLEKTINTVRLIPGTPKLLPINIGEFNELQIWGVVTFVIKRVG